MSYVEYKSPCFEFESSFFSNFGLDFLPYPGIVLGTTWGGLHGDRLANDGYGRPQEEEVIHHDRSN